MFLTWRTELLFTIFHALLQSVPAAEHPVDTGSKRLPSYYVFTAPEIVHPGEVASIGVTLSGRWNDVLLHAYVKTWHGGKMLASAHKMVPSSGLGEPFILDLKIANDAEEGYALLVFRMLRNPYKEESRMIKIKKEKPKILIRTNKGYYRYGENVDVWILALNQHAKPFKGQVKSVLLMDSNEDVIDYKRNIPLIKGIATISLSTKNAMEEGGYKLKVEIKGKETSVMIYVGNNVKDYIERNKKLYHIKTPVQSRQIVARSPIADLKLKMYTPSGTKIKILLLGTTFQPEDEAEAIIIYNNPANGLNTFVYEVVCQKKIFIHKRVHDLFSSMYCSEGAFRLLDRFSRGPTRDQLCADGQTRFTIKFKVQKYMCPDCRLLIYQVREDKEFIAADKSFKVAVKPETKLELSLDKESVKANEDISINVKGVSGGTILLTSQNYINNIEDDKIMCEQTIRWYQVNRTTEDEIASISNYCHGEDFVTAGQCFRNCGLEVITELSLDPTVPCEDRRRIHFIRRPRKKRDLNSLKIIGGTVTPWLWKKIELTDHQASWRFKIKAPNEAGTYYIEAFSVSETNGVDAAGHVHIQVEPMEKQVGNISRATEARAELKAEVKKTFHDLTIKITPDLEQLFFVLRDCQPLKMQICLRPSKSIEGDSFTLEIHMVPGFSFVDEDLRKIYRKKQQLLFYVNLQERALLFVKKPKYTRTCLYVGLKQHGRFRKRQNSAVVTYFPNRDRGDKKSITYWITDKDCRIK